MIVKIFSVYDSKVEAYIQPFFMQSRGQAIRAFGDTAGDKTTNIGKHPADFTLFELGTFDPLTAKFDIYVTPESLGVAVEYLTQSDKPQTMKDFSV